MAKFDLKNTGTALSSAASLVDTSANAYIQNKQIADMSGIESEIDNMNSYIVGANDNTSLLNEWGTWQPLNALTYDDVRGVSRGEQWGNAGSAALKGAAAGATLGSVIPGIGTAIGAGVGALIGGGAALAGTLKGQYDAAEKEKELNKQIEQANNQMQNSFINKANVIDTQNDMRALSNFFEYGGDLQSDPFTNGVININSGGTHEQNPNEGVQIGIDAEGIPNLVEEGEVVWDNYVFSNRLKPDVKFLKQYKLKGKTFADVANYIQKESKERPYDSISKKGLNDLMNRLKTEQENMKNVQLLNRGSNNPYGNLFATGGPAGSLYAHTEDNEGYTEDNIVGMTKRGVLMDDSNIVPLINISEEPKGFFKNTNNLTSSGETGGNQDKFSASYLRYAPVIGNIAGLLENLGSPDYSRVDALETAFNRAGRYTPVQYNPLGNYMEYKPMDRNYYASKLGAQANATRSAIINNSGGNRAAAIAGLLATDYNAQSQYGDLLKKAEEYNLAQRQAVEQFNRGTNQANSSMALQASAQNQAAKQKADAIRLQGLQQTIAMKEAIDQQRAATRSANLNALLDSLAGIGSETFWMNNIQNSPWLLYSYNSDGSTEFKAQQDKTQQGNNDNN